MRTKLLILLLLLLTGNVLYAGTWEELWTQSPPTARTGHVAVYDPDSHSMLIMGESSFSDPNIYYLDLGTAEWIVKVSSSTVKRTSHSAVYDSNKKRILVFGGSPLGRNVSSGYENKTYAWNFGTETWELLTTEGTPPTERIDHSAIYDIDNNRMVIFGGINKELVLQNSVYSLDLSQDPPVWSELTTSSTTSLPGRRYKHTAIYDLQNKRMIVFGGTSTSTANDDLWTLDLSTLEWNQELPTGDSPSDLTGHTAVYDPSGSGSMIIFGGTDPLVPGQYVNDTYILDLTQMTWEKMQAGLNPPSGTSGHTAIYDTYENTMIIFGGYNGTKDLNNCYILNIIDHWPPASSAGEVFNYPNPFSAGTEQTHICFYLDKASRVSIKIFSLIGDLVKEWSIDGKRGINEVLWDGYNGIGRLVENGGYICLIDKPNSISKFKIAVLK